ncbi:MAG: fructose-1,6-bisphosphatase [Candidatus Nealsonbacteria bacterium]|nr:fructose-1,6-bisphosphatase [Candidatus Nealsonbacteria bacterium]
MNIDNYLEKNGHSEELRDLIKIIVDQIRPIKNEFLGGDKKSGTYNIYGEKQIKLDKRANEILLMAFRNSKLVKQVGSEEEEEAIQMDSDKGHFGVTIDPLDGSSLIPTNLAVGIIFSIYENGDIMSGLKNITQAFYVLLGPMTLMVFADKSGVSQFIYNDKGAFDLVKENIIIPEGNLYSPGGLRKEWTDAHRDLISGFEENGFKLRYSGSFVPDFHQVLVYGGIFSYPALVDKPNGKLRLLFEVGPMAFIAEKAGGGATDGKIRILDIIPAEIDQRVPLYIGSKKLIEGIKI